MKEKVCPICGAKFICNHDNIAICQCASVKLSPSAKAYIKDTYSDCLCASCLRAIAKQHES